MEGHRDGACFSRQPGGGLVHADTLAVAVAGRPPSSNICLYACMIGRQASITTTKTLICPGWETAVVPVSQPGTPVRDKRGCPFVPGLATGTEEDLLSRLVTPTGTKGAASAHVAGAPFCPGWCWSLFFSCFSFLNSFSISIILLHFN